MRYATLQRLLITVVGLLNIGTGVYGIIQYSQENLFKESALSWIFLSIYLAVFGTLLAVTNVSAAVHERLVGTDGAEGLFGFLATTIGRALFILFIGTLGLGFGFDTSQPDKGVPFVGGCISIALAIITSFFVCCRDENEQVS